MALRHRPAVIRQEDLTTGKWLRAAELAPAWLAHFSAINFSARLNIPADTPPVSPKSLTLLRSVRTLATGLRHLIQNHKLGDDNSGTQTPVIGNPGLERPRASRPQDRVETSGIAWNTTFPGRSGYLPPYRSRTCLPRFASRGMITTGGLDDGRRRAVDRSQLGPMNHPMHRRPRRRPRKWNTHRRGPRDRYRSADNRSRLTSIRNVTF